MQGKASYHGRGGRPVVALALVAAAVAAAPLSADRLEHRYDSLGRLTTVCNAVPNDGERTDYTLDPADNRSRYKNTKTDIVMPPGSEIASANGQYRLRFRPEDGNLVLYRNSDNAALWQAGTAGSGARITYFQSDGNLVVYTQSGSAFSSDTYMYACASLSVDDDGHARIRSTDGVVRWQKP